MSELIKRLKQVSESVAPSLGFKTTSASPSRPMLLIAAVSGSDVTRLDGIADTKVDAVIVHSRDLREDIKNLNKITGSIGDIPWGVMPESMIGEDIKELMEAGSDCIAFKAATAPAALLEEEAGKIIRLSLFLDDAVIKTVDQMPIDAILLELRGEGDTITVAHIVECQRFSLSTRKPIIVATDQKLDNSDLQALWEAGINGVLVETKKELQPELIRLHQAIEAISKTPRKSGERGVMLPHLNK